LLLEDRTTDLHAEAIDVALRIGFLRDSALVATRIGTVGRVFAASPAYLRRAGKPKTLVALRGHSVLNYSLLSVREEWGRLIGDPGEQLDLKVPLAANNAEALAECAIQGMGIVLLPEFVLAPALADGRLVQLLADASPEPFGLFAVRPSRQFTPARLRLFIDYLRECGF